MADCEYTIAGDDRIYSESEFKKLLSEGYLDKVMIENKIKIRNIKPNEELAKIFQMPAAIQPTAEIKTEETVTPTAEVKAEEVVTPVAEVKTEETITPVAEVTPTEDKKKEVIRDGNDLILRHGTPHDFDKFQLEKIGTGEGAQAFGYGLYFTDGSRIAEGYAKKLSKDKTGLVYEVRIKNGATKNWAEWREPLDQDVEDKLYNSLTNEEKAEYQEHLDKAFYPDSPIYDMNYEKDYTGSFDDLQRDKYGIETYEKPSAVGNIYSDLKDAFGQQKATEIFKRAGIDGIKYRSRRGFGDNYNYVVFDPNSIEIIKKEAPIKPVTKTEEKVTEPTAEEVTPEAKQKRIETATKNFADFLRGAKIEEGSARSTIIPIPPKLWNKAVDIVADSVQSGGVSLGNFSDFLDASIKNIKDSDLFKSLTPKEKGSFTRNIRKELSKYAAEQFNLTFEQADIRGAEFTDLNNELETAKTTTPTAKQFETLKNKAKKFVERNLPDDVYNKSEVIKEINNNFDKVKTVAGIQKALERENKRIENKEFKIETAEAKQAEKERKATIKEIINLTKPTSPKMISKNRRTGVKKANVSLDALRQINEMRDKGLFDKDNLESKTKEELDALKEQIQNIQAGGRAEKKSETKEKKEVKKSSEALILETLDKPNATLNSEEEILDFMERRNGVVVVDNQVMSKSAFKEFAKENEDKDYTGTKFYINKDTELKEQKQEKKGVLKTARKYTMAAIRDLDTYMKDISKGSKELRDWTKENILDPTKKAIYNKVKNTAKFKGEYRDAVKNIFGGFSSAIDYLSKDSGISTDVSDLEGVKAKKINRDQAVHIYGLINNPDAKKAEKNIERLKSKNHIDTDKVKALVEGDPKLMAYYDFLREMYDKKFREEFGSTIENLYGIPLDKGYYWPEPAGVSETLELNLEGFSNKELSMIAPNMRQRDPKYNGPFELANSYDVYNRYVESMVHAKEFIPVIENSRTLLSDVNRPRVLDKLNDTNKYNDLIDLMKVVFTDKNPYKTSSMDFLANYTAVKTLWLRLKAIPQQASAFLNYYNAGWVDGINPAQIIASVVPKNATEIDFALDFYKDNPYLWERLKGASNQEMKAIEAQVDTVVSELGKKVIDKAVFAALSPIKAGDFLATSTPFGGGAFAMAQFKKRFKDNGGDYQDAKDFALQRWFEETERTQQPAIDKSIVSAATYDPMYRFLVPFVSAQNSMGKKIVKSAKDIQDWKNLTKQEKNQAVADMLYYTVVGSIPFSLMSGTLLTVLDVAEEEDEEAKENMFDRITFDLLADNVMSNIQSLYFVGFATNLVLNQMRGREYFNERPQGETINSFTDFVSSLAMASSDWDFLTEEMKKDYFARFKLKGKELEEFNDLPEDEKIDYLRKNAVKTGIISNDKESISKFKEEFSNQSRFNRMGKKGMDGFLKLFGIDKPMNLYRDISNYIDDNGTFEELIYGEGAGTTKEAEPFSKNVPKQFFDAILYKRDNQLFKSYSDILGKPEEYYDIYPSKPGGPISNPVSEPDVNQSEKEVQGVMIKRKRPGLKRIEYGN
jgi:hypothetical protein